MFEKGNFAGLAEMKRNPRLFDRVAPMGVNDIIMAVSYQHAERPALNIPVTALDGLLDDTIDRGNMEQWAGYTSQLFRNVAVDGDHYFVSSHFRQVCSSKGDLFAACSWKANLSFCHMRHGIGSSPLH